MATLPDMLKRFHKMVTDVYPSVPVFVATNQHVWEYGNGQIGDLISQKEMPAGLCRYKSDRESSDTVSWDTFPVPSEDHIVETPGFHPHTKFIWEWRYLSGLFGSGSKNLFLLWWDYQGENGLLDYFGTPKNWNLYMDGGSSEDPGEETPEETPEEIPEEIREEAIAAWGKFLPKNNGKIIL